MSNGIGPGGNHLISQMVQEQRRDLIDLKRGVQNGVTTDASRADLEEGADITSKRILVPDTSKAEDMAAFIAQIRSRREIEKRGDFFSDFGLEYVLDEEANSKIETLIPILKSDAKNKAEILLQQSRNLFTDDSCLIAALRVLLRRRSLFVAETDIIYAALTDAEDQSKTKPTKAGINVALKARLYGQKLKMTPASVRIAYRDFIQSDDKELLIYEKWVSFYGPERRHVLVDFMEKALLTDIEASDPSCSIAEFGFLLRRLGQIKLIRSADALFIYGVMNNVLTRKFVNTEDKWLLFLMSSLQKPEEIYATLAEICNENIKNTPKNISGFFQIILNKCQLLPEEIFTSALAKEQLLTNIISLVTEACDADSKGLTTGSVIKKLSVNDDQ